MFHDGTDRHTDGHGDSMTNSAQWGRVGENVILSVLLFASVERFFVSRMRDFFYMSSFGSLIATIKIVLKFSKTSVGVGGGVDLEID